jgi:hypothetical protein
VGQGQSSGGLGEALVMWLVIAIVAVGILVVCRLVRVNKTFKEITKL